MSGRCCARTSVVTYMANVCSPYFFQKLMTHGCQAYERLQDQLARSSSGMGTTDTRIIFNRKNMHRVTRYLVSKSRPCPIFSAALSFGSRVECIVQRCTLRKIFLMAPRKVNTGVQYCRTLILLPSFDSKLRKSPRNSKLGFDTLIYGETRPHSCHLKVTLGFNCVAVLNICNIGSYPRVVGYEETGFLLRIPGHKALREAHFGPLGKEI